MTNKNVHGYITWEQAGQDMLEYFSPKEFGYPHKMNSITLFELDRMRGEEGKHAGIIITINSDFRPDDKRSHGSGLAIDLVIRDKETKEPLPVLEQFFIAARYNWKGIGMYPFWDTPGIHVDMQGLCARKRFWWRDVEGGYRTMKAFVEEIDIHDPL